MATMNSTVQGGYLLGEVKLSNPREANFCIVQPAPTKADPNHRQRIFCKLVGENAARALDFVEGHYVEVEGKLVTSEALKAQYVHAYKAAMVPLTLEGLNS